MTRKLVPDTCSINFMLFNPRSLNNKIADFMTLLEDREIAIAGICETWLSESNSVTTGVLRAMGYSIVHDYRHFKRGGGTAIVFKSELCGTRCSLDCNSYSTMEYTCSSFKLENSETFAILIIYRTGQLTSSFHSELDTLLASAACRFDKLIVAGDFNIHFENTVDVHAHECLETASGYGMTSLVHSPTHIQGGTIDQIFSLNCSVSSVEILINNHLQSDHYPICCCIILEPSKKTKKTIT